MADGISQSSQALHPKKLRPAEEDGGLYSENSARRCGDGSLFAFEKNNKNITARVFQTNDSPPGRRFRRQNCPGYISLQHLTGKNPTEWAIMSRFYAITTTMATECGIGWLGPSFRWTRNWLQCSFRKMYISQTAGWFQTMFSGAQRTRQICASRFAGVERAA